MPALRPGQGGGLLPGGARRPAGRHPRHRREHPGHPGTQVRSAVILVI